MNWKVLFGLFLATTIYCVFGALLFMYVEGVYGKGRPPDAGLTLSNMSRYLQDRYQGLSEQQYELIIRDVVSRYSTGELQIDDKPVSHRWDFPSTFFFVITTLSTIGYGSIVPKTALGRAICIVYCLFGIPLFFYTLAGIGEKINTFNRRFKYSLDPSLTCAVFLVRFTLTFTIGWICFIQLPALIFTTVEGWDYADSIYFSFITLTTIGFGDLTPDPTLEYGSLTRLTLTVWLFLGLAWLSATIKAIQDIINHIIYDGKEDSSPKKRLSSTLHQRSIVRPGRLSVSTSGGRNIRSRSVDYLASASSKGDADVIMGVASVPLYDSKSIPPRIVYKIPGFLGSSSSIESDFLYKVLPVENDVEVCEDNNLEGAAMSVHSNSNMTLPSASVCVNDEE